MANFESFRSDNWAEMNFDERVEALQDAENQIAEEQGREPRTVVPDERCSELNCNGYYSMDDPGNLHVNPDLIANDEGNYKCLQNVAHEGRHAYQHDCIEGKIENPGLSPDEISAMEHNSAAKDGVYLQGDGTFSINQAEYRFQPKEADANDFAKQTLDENAGQFEGDPAFEKHCADRDEQTEKLGDLAEEHYGEDYKQAIQNKVEAQYQANQQSVSQYNSSLESSPSAEQSEAADQTESVSETVSEGQSY